MANLWEKDKLAPLPATGQSLWEQDKIAPPLSAKGDSPSLAGEFGKGIATGYRGMTSALAGDVEMGGHALDMPGIKQWGREAGDAQQALGEQYAPAVGRWEDIRSLGDFGRYAAHGIGQALPTIAPSLAGAGAGAVLGSPFGPPGMAIGGALGAFVPSFAQEAGSIYRENREKTGQESPGVALTAGAAAGALDALAPLRLAGQLGLGLPVKEAIKRGALRTIGDTLAIEGVTEGAQRGIERGATAYLDPNQPVFTSEGVSEITNSALLGALGGGAIGGAVHVAGMPAEARAKAAEAKVKADEQERLTRIANQAQYEQDFNALVQQEEEQKRLLAGGLAAGLSGAVGQKTAQDEQFRMAYAALERQEALDKRMPDILGGGYAPVANGTDYVNQFGTPVAQNHGSLGEVVATRPNNAAGGTEAASAPFQISDGNTINPPSPEDHIVNAYHKLATESGNPNVGPEALYEAAGFTASQADVEIFKKTMAGLAQRGTLLPGEPDENGRFTVHIPSGGKIIKKADGKGYPSEKAIATALRNRADTKGKNFEPFQLGDGTWAGREVVATTPETIPPPAEIPAPVAETGPVAAPQVEEKGTVSKHVAAPPATPAPILGLNGKPYASERAANLAMKNRKDLQGPYRATPLDGGGFGLVADVGVTPVGETKAAPPETMPPPVEKPEPVAEELPVAAPKVEEVAVSEPVVSPPAPPAPPQVVEQEPHAPNGRHHPDGWFQVGKPDTITAGVRASHSTLPPNTYDSMTADQAKAIIAEPEPPREWKTGDWL